MWCKYLLEAQGYAIENNILYQYNKSTILLANNGKMSAGKNSKQIKNKVFLITDKVVMGYLDIQHKGTDEMWDDVNTNPTQGKRSRVIRGHVMGISEDYDNNVERRRTHPLLLPKIGYERLSVIDGEVLEKSSIVTPEKQSTNKTEKRTNVSFPPRAMPAEKQRSVLGEGKYSPSVEPAWKAGNDRFLVFYKALVEKPDPGVHRDMCKVAR